jgi:hypothetical protein
MTERLAVIAGLAGVMRTGGIRHDGADTSAHDTADHSAAHRIRGDATDHGAGRTADCGTFCHTGITSVSACAKGESDGNEDKHRFHVRMTFL